MGKEQKILEELIGSKPEQLTGEAKRLFEAIRKSQNVYNIKISS